MQYYTIEFNKESKELCIIVMLCCKYKYTSH